MTSTYVSVLFAKGIVLTDDLFAELPAALFTHALTLTCHSIQYSTPVHCRLRPRHPPPHDGLD